MHGPSVSLWLVSTKDLHVRSYMRTTRTRHISWVMRSPGSSYSPSRDAWVSHKLAGLQQHPCSSWVRRSFLAALITIRRACITSIAITNNGNLKTSYYFIQPKWLIVFFFIISFFCLIVHLRVWWKLSPRGLILLRIFAAIQFWFQQQYYLHPRCMKWLHCSLVNKPTTLVHTFGTRR